MQQLEDRSLLSNVQIDFSGVFNHDGIRNRSGGSDDNVDDSIDGATQSRLVTTTFAQNQSVDGNGLPDDGFFSVNPFHPDVQLGYRNADDGNNLVFLDTLNESFTVQVPNGTYDTLHVFALSTGGVSAMNVTLNYADGMDAQATQVQDWFSELTDGDTSGDAIRYNLINDMDRITNTNVFENANDAAVFGHEFDVDESRVLQSVTIQQASDRNLAVLGATADATSLIVDTNEDVSDGDFAPGDTSLREALEITGAASDGSPDVITFDASVTGTISLASSLLVDDSVIITGPGADRLAVSGNNNNFRVLTVTDGGPTLIDVEISGLTIRDGGTGIDSIRGAGIDSLENLTLRRVSVEDNDAGPNTGGGLNHDLGSLTIVDSTFSGNHAEQGGGIEIDDAGAVSAQIINTTISGNTSDTFGGGIEALGGSTTIRNSTITGNQADVDNAGTEVGGGVDGNIGVITLHNTLVAGNTRAAGTVADDVGTTLLGGSSFNLIGDAASAGGLTDGSDGNIVGVAGVGTRPIAQILNTSLSDNLGPTRTHLLVTGSVAEDAGDHAQAIDENGVALVHDQRGAPFDRMASGSTDIGATELQPAVLTVDKDGDVDDGIVGVGELTLREAIRLANTHPGGDFIDIHVPSIVLNGTLPAIEENLTIISNHVDGTTIQGDGLSRLIIVEAPVPTDPVRLRLDRLELTNGQTTGDGGAVHHVTGSLEIANSEIVFNTADSGGAIYLGSGDLEITNSTLNANSATLGGGAVYVADGEITITDSTISDNTAGADGGGLTLIQNGGLTATNATIHNNRADGNGGGIYLPNTGAAVAALLTLTDSTISDNTADLGFSGGGVFLSGGSDSVINRTLVTGNLSTGGDAGGLLIGGDAVVAIVDSEISVNTTDGLFGGGIRTTGTADVTIVNTTISGNLALEDGGGIDHSSTGTLTVRNSTITGNRAQSDDGGFGDGGGIWIDGTVILHNTIVAGNFEGSGTTPDDIQFNVDASSSFNIIGDSATSGGLTHGTNSNIVGNAGTGTLDITTVLDTTLDDNGGPTFTHALVDGSPALDAGSNAEAVDHTATPLALDQRQHPFERVFGGTVDIGSFEARNKFTVGTNTDVDDGDLTPGEISLREALTLAGLNPGPDEIHFNPLLSGSTITLADQLQVDSDVTLKGPGAESLTIDGDNSTRLFTVSSGTTVTMAHLTLQNGNATGGGEDGGAILNDGDLTLHHVRVTGNTAADDGGGIFNQNAGSLTILHSELSNNTAAGDFGGALRDFSSGTVTIINSTISGNIALSDGGGIDQSGDNPMVIRNSTITGNRADSDGDDDGLGGGLWVGDGGLELYNTIIAGNFRGTGTVANDLENDDGDNIDPGSAFNLIGDAATSGGLTDGTNGNIVGNAGAGTLDINVILNTTLALTGGQTRVHSLPDGSPAVNAASDAQALDENGAPLTFDQRGPSHPRMSGTTDIGAFEKLLGAFDDAAVTTTGTPVNIPVLANDTPATRTEIFSLPTGPTSGAATFNGSVDYTPNPGFTGADSLTYLMGLEQTKVGPGDVAADSDFGHSIAVDGDWMVVGGISDDTPNTDGGTALVYRRDGGTWTLHQRIEASDEAATDRYGYAVAISGTTIVVSARMDDDSGFNSGSVYIWEYDASKDSWTNTDKLLDPQGQEKDQFGHSVGIDGDTLIVGARLADGQGTNSGAVLIFERTTSGWVVTKRIKATDAQGGDQFGFAVAISGDTAVVTARKDDDPGRDGGSAYILQRNQGGPDEWGEVAKILSSTGVVNDWFGQSADIEGDTVVIGKPIRNGRRRPGQIHVYERNEGGADNWGEIRIVQDSNTTPDQDQFGYSVSISGNRLLGGSRRDDTGGGNAGNAYLFNRNSGGSNNWGQINFFLALDPDQGDNAGSAVAIDGNTVAIGAPGDDGGGAAAGAAYIEDLRDKTATVTIQVNAPLRSAVGVGPGANARLRQSVLDATVRESIGLWQSVPGITAEHREALETVTAFVEPLDGELLGYESGGRIGIDDDAAGHGWAIEGSRHGMHLLTVVTHEIGHVLGLPDLYQLSDRNDIMYGFLAPGEERSPLDEGGLDLVFHRSQLHEDGLFGP